jgi:hypothetical protein
LNGSRGVACSRRRGAVCANQLGREAKNPCGTGREANSSRSESGASPEGCWTVAGGNTPGTPSTQTLHPGRGAGVGDQKAKCPRGVWRISPKTSQTIAPTGTPRALALIRLANQSADPKCLCFELLRPSGQDLALRFGTSCGEAASLCVPLTKSLRPLRLNAPSPLVAIPQPRVTTQPQSPT